MSQYLYGITWDFKLDMVEVEKDTPRLYIVKEYKEWLNYLKRIPKKTTVFFTPQAAIAAKKCKIEAAIAYQEQLIATNKQGLLDLDSLEKKLHRH